MLSEHSVTLAGPPFHVDLAALDARHPIHYGRRLLIFRCTSLEQQDLQLASFKTGVGALVKKCPILGGRVVPLPPEQAKNGNEDWRTIIPGDGVEVIVRDLTTSLPSFAELEKENFPPSELPYDLLVPIPADIGNDRPFAACKMQFSAIEGGTILTFAMSHCVGDGSGNNELMRILSEEVRRAQKSGGNAVEESLPGSATVQIGLDRSLLRNMKSDEPFNFENHPAFVKQVMPLTNAAALSDFAANAPEIPVTLHISSAGLAQLKEDATSPDGPPISTHDALAALMWRTILSIRSQRSANQLAFPITANFYMPSDARRHVGLTGAYIGNVVYQLTASLELSTLLSSGGLREAASAIRQAIKAVNTDLVMNYMAQIHNKWVDWKFLTDYSTTGLGMGTDWTSGIVYQDDWGEAFGPLVRFRYPGEAFNCIFPKLSDGSAEFSLSVMPAEAEKLKSQEHFGKYLKN